MNQRAFNLFTALISFILIILATLLVQSMIQSERNTSVMISNIENESKLRAVGEMARADAIQVFNYYMRNAIEKWLTSPSNTYTLGLDKKKWNDILEDYASANFGGKDNKNVRFAEFASNTMSGLFSVTKTFGSYSVCIHNSLSDCGNAGDTKKLREVLAQMTGKSVESGDFFKVVGCDNGNPYNCPQGTFYINLKVQSLDDKTYELLPRIFVTDKTTGNTIQLGILPKTNFRIFVPIRIFKAIANARALAQYPSEDTQNKYDAETFNEQDDYGLFSPRIHNELEEMALGMCDKGYCNPRTNPYVPPSQKNIDKACPGVIRNATTPIGDVEIGCDSGLSERGLCETGKVVKYDPNKSGTAVGSAEKAILDFAKKRICNIAFQNNALNAAKNDQTFEFVKGACSNNDFIQSIEVRTESLNSKKITYSEDGSEFNPLAWWAGTFQPIGGYLSQEYLANIPFGISGFCPMQGNVNERKAGYYSGMDGKIENFTERIGLACSGTAGSEAATCAEISGIEVTLAFKEKNPAYLVNKKNIENLNSVYKIKLTDSFTPFAPAHNSNNVLGNCALSEKPSRIAGGCSFDSHDWSCNSTGNRCNPAN